MRVLLAVFIAVSAFIALNKDSLGYIADMMGISWGALAGAFLAPFLYGLYWKKTTKAAVWVSFAYGVGIMIIQLLVSLKLIVFSGGVLGFVFQNSLYSGVFAMVGGLVIVPIISLLTQKSKPDGTDKMFECYNVEVTVSAKRALNEK